MQIVHFKFFWQADNKYVSLLLCSSCSRQKKFNVHLCQKVLFVLACFQASAMPRPENSDSDEKDALFGLDTLMSYPFKYKWIELNAKYFPMQE
jgi:hypothetical protein